MTEVLAGDEEVKEQPRGSHHRARITRFRVNLHEPIALKGGMMC
jgi:hypothetical protein